MKNTKFLSSIGSSFNKMGFQLKKHSPEILIVSGVIGTIASAVLACKATTKISSILEEAKNDIDDIHEGVISEYADDYTAEDAKKDLVIVYAQTGIKIAKLYGPSIILGVLSLGGIVASNNILRKRNVALAAAYATIDAGFKEYRKRVVERFGEEIDRELKYDIKATKIDKIVVDENGKEKKVKETINVVNPNLGSGYARYFDEGSRCWEPDSEANLFFLHGEQNYANDRLRARGYLFLNEVYERLDIPQTKAGQMVGWIYNPDNPNGDNYVDFGIYDVHREVARDFVNGYEKVILLDFNVDGDIWKHMSNDKYQPF